MARKLFVLALIAFLVGVSPLGTAEAAEIVVTISGPDGQVVSWPDRRRTELRLKGKPPVVFTNTTTILSPTRVTVWARDDKHTLTAWGLRTGRFGGIALSTKVGRKSENVVLPIRTIAVQGERAARR